MIVGLAHERCVTAFSRAGEGADSNYQVAAAGRHEARERAHSPPPEGHAASIPRLRRHYLCDIRENFKRILHLGTVPNLLFHPWGSVLSPEFDGDVCAASASSPQFSTGSTTRSICVAGHEVADLVDAVQHRAVGHARRRERHVARRHDRHALENAHRALDQGAARDQVALTGTSRSMRCAGPSARCAIERP